MRELINGENNAATRRCELKKYLGAEGERIKRETRQACDCFWEPTQIPKRSRFSSGNWLWQSKNSEGVKDIDANRQKNKSKIFEERVFSTFQ